MDELVERVARAIYEAKLGPENTWAAHRDEARAAIEAIEAAGYRIVPDDVPAITHIEIVNIPVR